MLVHVPSFGRNPRGTPDFLAYPVHKAYMHVLGTGVPRCLGVARSASSPKAAQALGFSLTPGLRNSFGQVTCMARAASVPGLWTLGFLLLCGACVWVLFVLGLGGQLRPATPGWVVGLCGCLCACSACTTTTPRWGVWCACVCSGSGFGCAPPLLAGVFGCACLCARSAYTPPLLAGVCGVGLCAWARVWAAPRHSCLGCRAVCVIVCALRLYPPTPSLGVRCGCVCLGSGFGCAPPFLAGVFGCVCVFVCALRSSPATPGWGVGLSRSCARSACTLPLLAGGCSVGVCVWARVLAAPPNSWLGCWAVRVSVRAPLVPRHSWLGCWGVCVFVCVLRLYPGTPGWGVRCGGLCLGSGFGCGKPPLAGVLECECLCARSACTPALLAGVCGVGVCAWARVSAAPRHSWLGCLAVCVIVCVLACTLPLRAWVCGVGVCVWAPVAAAPRHSWLGC